jgi:hypothetical protein
MLYKTEFMITMSAGAVGIFCNTIVRTDNNILLWLINGCLKLALIFFFHVTFSEVKKLIKLGELGYQNLNMNGILVDLGVPTTKWEWITKRTIYLISMVSNFQTAFLVFFAVEFFELYHLYETPTPTPTVVIPEKFPEDFQETDDVCPICTESPEILVLGCRHVMCGDCLNMLPAKNCPKCRHPIDMALVKQRPVTN